MNLFETETRSNKVAVINFNKITKTSITASNRIAMFISRRLDAFLIDNKLNAMIHKNDSFEVLYVVNGMFGFCDFKEECVMMCEKAKKVVWVTNDYDIKIPSQLKGIKDNCITMAEYPSRDEEGSSEYYRHFQISWNKLTYEPCEQVEHFKYPGLFYYGAFRKNRQDSFKKYMGKPPYHVRVSTSPKNQEEFEAINPTGIKFSPPSTGLYAQLSNFEFTVYMTDNMKHPVSFANRFYECLSGGLFMLFDKYALEKMNFEGDGFNPKHFEDFVVDSQEEVVSQLKYRGQLLKFQKELFFDRDFKKELEDRFDEVVKIIS